MATNPITKNELDQALKAQTKELKAYVNDTATEQTEALARIVNSAFETQNQWLKQEFEAVRKDLDVRKRLEQYDRKFRKLEHALNVKL